MPGLRQNKNLRRLLCRAKLSPPPATRPTRTSRTTPGWSRCSSSRGGRQCPICPITFAPTSEVVGNNGYRHKITQNVNCQTKNCIYYWKCVKTNCIDHPRNEYIGKTTAHFQQRLSQHRDYVKRGENLEPSGEHFNLRPGHNVSDIRGIVLEEVTSDDPYILKAREHHYISLFDTYNKGLQ